MDKKIVEIVLKIIEIILKGGKQSKEQVHLNEVRTELHKLAPSVYKFANLRFLVYNNK